MPKTDQPFKVGNWLVDASADTVSTGDQTIKLEPRTMQVLLMLVSSAGAVVSRDDLLDTVWHDLEVTENSLSQAIRSLRKAFNDKPANPQYIQTVPKRGYKLLAAVTTAESTSSTTPAKTQVNTSFRFLLFSFIVLVVSAAVSLLIGRHWLDPDSPNSATIRPITVLKGNSNFPSFSPDGQYLAFSHRNDQNSPWQIYVSDLQQTFTQRLSSGKSKDDSPVWHPSKPNIAFHRRSDTRCDIYLLALNPENLIVESETQLFQCDPSSYTMQLAWSTDGESLYYSDGDSFEAPYRIYRFELTSETKTQLTNPPQGHRGDYAISLSKNGRFLAFLRNKQWTITEIRTLDLISGEQKLIKTLPWVVYSISWKSDDQLLIDTSNGMLQQVDVHSGDTRNFLQRNDSAFSPAVSPDENKVAFVMGDKKQLDIEIRSNPKIQSNSNHPGTLILDQALLSTRNDSRPVFANRSRQFVFVSNRTGLPQIWLRDAHGSVTQLSQFKEHYDMKHLRWSPDDLSILSHGRGRLFKIDVKTAQVSWLTGEDSVAIFGTWSRDGRSVYYPVEKNNIWQIWNYSLKDKSNRQITFNGGSSLQESFDGSSLYYTKFEKPGLWKKTSDKQNDELIIEHFPHDRWDSWQLVEDGIYYASQGMNSFDIRFYSFTSKREKTLLSRQNTSIATFSVSHDEQLIAYTLILPTDSEIMILE